MQRVLPWTLLIVGLLVGYVVGLGSRPPNFSGGSGRPNRNARAAQEPPVSPGKLQSAGLPRHGGVSKRNRVAQPDTDTGEFSNRPTGTGRITQPQADGTACEFVQFDQQHERKSRRWTISAGVVVLEIHQRHVGRSDVVTGRPDRQLLTSTSAKTLYEKITVAGTQYALVTVRAERRPCTTPSCSPPAPKHGRIA